MVKYNKNSLSFLIPGALLFLFVSKFYIFELKFESIMTLRVLFIGDIVGKPGLQMVQTWLPSLEKKYRADLIIANGENVADGKVVQKRRGRSSLG